MRWLGALSLARLVSGTMRTFLVWTLRVTISPWNSLPDFLKEPMLAMSLLLGCFEPATTAASMAICRPEAIDDAPLAGRSTAEDGGGESFLPREECRLRRQGRKSHRRHCVSGDRGAAVLRPDQAIERPCGP